MHPGQQGFEPDTTVPGVLERDTGRVVSDPHAAVEHQSDRDTAGAVGQDLVHCPLYDLEHQVVQTTLVGRADVHPRPFPDGFPILKHLNVSGVVFGGFLAHDVPSDGVPQTASILGEIQENTRSEPMSRGCGRVGESIAEALGSEAANARASAYTVSLGPLTTPLRLASGTQFPSFSKAGPERRTRCGMA